MTLATHIIFAEALAKPLVGKVNPFAGFLFGMFTHYLIDAVPHYDYALGSAKQERADGGLSLELHITPSNTRKDLAKIALDIAIGTAAGIITVHPPLTFAGLLPYAAVAIGAILPDALQSVYWFYRGSPIKETKLFHDYWHAKERLQWNLLGVGSQAIIFMFSLLILSH